MEYLIKDLIEKLSERKKEEIELVEMYKTEEIKELLLISAGKIMEMDHMIHELKEMIKYNSKSKIS